MEHEPAALPPAAPALPTAIIVAGVVALAALTGGGIALRNDLLARLAAQETATREATDAITRKLSSLEAQLANTKPDTAAIDALRGELTTAQENAAKLNERLTSLEKKPEPSKPAIDDTTLALRQAVESGEPYQAALDIWFKSHPKTAHSALPHLQEHAPGGVPTELALRHDARRVIEQLVTPTEVATETGLLGAVNRHFGGLITIRKQAPLPPALTTLREQLDTASLPSLTARIKALAENEKTPFTQWLEQADARAQAVNELATLTVTPDAAP